MSLTGRYGHQGRLAAAGLQQAVEDVSYRGGVRVGRRTLIPEVVIFDDGGTRAGVRHALDVIARADLVIGPYGSDLVVEAARWAGERTRVLWNHGGSADDAQGLSGVVSLPAPASRYFAPVLDAFLARYPAPVYSSPLAGALSGARQPRVRLGPRAALVWVSWRWCPTTNSRPARRGHSLGGGLVRRRRGAHPPAPSATPGVAAVAAGLGAFAAEVRAEGVLAPSQWEEGARFHPDAGIRPSDVVRSLRARISPFLDVRPNLGHIDYPTAQAYAAGLIALRCVQEAGVVEDAALHAAALRLHCTTFFGRYGLGPDGRQADHEVLVVQWRQQGKRLVWPPSLAEVPVEI